MDDDWLGHVEWPVDGCPMFLVSRPDLLIAACRAGIIGIFSPPHTRGIPESLEVRLERIQDAQRDSETEVRFSRRITSMSDRRTDPRTISRRRLGSPSPSSGATGAHESRRSAGRLRSRARVRWQRHPRRGDHPTRRQGRRIGCRQPDAGVRRCRGSRPYPVPLAFRSRVRRFFDGPMMLARGHRRR